MAPFCNEIFLFCLSAPKGRHCLDSSPALLATTADKLRYYRNTKGLLQREVADHAGIDRSTYINYEKQAHGLYDFAALAKIAALLGVALDDLLDEHNRFVFAQGENLKSLRKQHKLTQAGLAALLGVNLATVKKWERGAVRMSRGSWEKMTAVLCDRAAQ